MRTFKIVTKLIKICTEREYNNNNNNQMDNLLIVSLFLKYPK